jgi:hypothetical protein
MGDSVYDLLQPPTSAPAPGRARLIEPAQLPEGARVGVQTLEDAQKLLKAAADTAADLLSSASASSGDLGYSFGRLHTATAAGAGAAALTVVDLSALQLAHQQHFEAALEKSLRRASLQWSQLSRLISQLSAQRSDVTGVQMGGGHVQSAAATAPRSAPGE